MASEAAGEPEGTPANWWWRTGPVDGGPAVVFDLDGVLSDAASRQHFLESARRDWDAFFSACGDDPLIEEVASLLSLLDAKLSVVLLTGRPMRVQAQTRAWLERYELRWDVLVMRDSGDYSATPAFKLEAVGQLRRHGFELCLAFEDDRRNVAMFREAGVPCIYIHSGYYD